MKFLFYLIIGGFSHGFQNQGNLLLNPVSNIALKGHAVKNRFTALAFRWNNACQKKNLYVIKLNITPWTKCSFYAASSFIWMVFHKETCSSIKCLIYPLRVTEIITAFLPVKYGKLKGWAWLLFLHISAYPFQDNKCFLKTRTQVTALFSIASLFG